MSYDSKLICGIIYIYYMYYIYLSWKNLYSESRLKKLYVKQDWFYDILYTLRKIFLM